MGERNFERTVLNLNKKAQDFYKEKKKIESLLLFQRAEELLKVYPSSKLELLTYNNIACFHIKENNLDYSLDYLSKCSKLTVSDLQSSYIQIGVQLNLSALKSIIQKHKEALAHSLKALEILTQSPNKYLKTVSYYSVGLEYEFLNQHSVAQEYFYDAKECSLQAFGLDHELTKFLHTILKPNNKSNTIMNEICILSDKFPNLRRNSVCNRANKQAKNTSFIKIDTTP